MEFEMKMNRRQALTLSTGALVAAAIGLRPGLALADVEASQKLIMEFTGGVEPQAGKITLTAPDIAENGNTVPVTVSVDSTMTEGDMVESVIIIAEDNPNPGVATFHFTSLSGSATASTRMRLARTQNVIAVAKMADGSVFIDKREVKVTIGGCGG